MSHVLVVEDKESHADWVRHTILNPSQGYLDRPEVTVVDSLEDVQRLIESHCQIDCAVLDMVIYYKAEPSRNRNTRPDFPPGIAALNLLLTAVPAQKILVYTQYSIEAVSNELRKHNMLNRLLVKPAHFLDFDDRIKEMLK